MAKLSKTETRNHNKALELIHSDKSLTWDDKEFIFRNWHEGANHMNGQAGAFFTPFDMAFDFALHVGSSECRIIDLCAGIGMLSFACQNRSYGVTHDITCVEYNSDYITVGKRLLPEANWIHGDALDLPEDIGHFDFCISNPPFGAIKRQKNGPRYTGKDFEFHIIDLASQIADYGVFVLPAMSAGFKYSGVDYYERHKDGKAFDFQKKFGIHFECGIGVDTSIYRSEWKGTSPATEIVSVDFTEEITEN